MPKNKFKKMDEAEMLRQILKLAKKYEEDDERAADKRQLNLLDKKLK